MHNLSFTFSQKTNSCLYMPGIRANITIKKLYGRTMHHVATIQLKNIIDKTDIFQKNNEINEAEKSNPNTN